MKSDARTRYTEKVIRESFLSCIAGKSYSRITVKEICEGAEINRATFYNHYRDVYDLMDRMKADLLADVDTLIEEADFTDLTAYLETLLVSMRREGKTWLALISENGRPEILIEIGKHITDQALPLLKENMKGQNETEIQLIYLYILNGTTGVMRQWLADGCRIPEEEVAKTLAALAERSIGSRKNRGGKMK